MGSCGNRDPLHPDEIQRLGRFTPNLQTKLNRFPDTLHQLIKRPCLGMTAGQCRNGRYEKSLAILFDHDIELTSHACLRGLTDPALPHATARPILPGPQPRAATLAQVSRRDTVRFHTSASGRLSGSGAK